MSCTFKLEEWLNRHKSRFVTPPGSRVKCRKQRKDINENVKKSKLT